MAGCGYCWSNSVSPPFFFFFFFPNTTPHPRTQSPRPRNVPIQVHKRSSSTNHHIQQQHFAHRSCVRHSSTRSCVRLSARALDARKSVTRVPVARGRSTCLFPTWSPASPVSLQHGALQYFATSTFCLLAITCRRDPLLYFYKPNNYNSQGLCLSKISGREFTNGRPLPPSTPVRLSVAHDSPNNSPPSTHVYHK